MTLLTNIALWFEPKSSQLGGCSLPLAVSIVLLFLSCVSGAQIEDVPQIGPKPFAAYFQPITMNHQLSPNVWGVAAVGPRDSTNGLEDVAMKKWDYWDGSILRGTDGKYRMFASRWNQRLGHQGWSTSVAVEAVSDSLLGPFIDKGPCWPNDEDGKGHNVIALRLPNGSYAIVVSETRNGDVFASQSVDGPWRHLGQIEVDQKAYHSLENAGDGQPLTGPIVKPWRGSNVSLIVRPDGRFEIVQRSGQILVSDSGILGPYVVQGDTIYRDLTGLPKAHIDRLEDPVIWFSGGWFHIIVNNWSERRAYHLISRDGISDWRYQGLAYEPGSNLIRYTDGSINHWNKLERPSVVMAKGHVVAITFAVTDVAKEDEKGSDGHGSKVIVIPFDGASMDRDLANADN